MQQEIENESFLGNLLDERHHDKMIQLNTSLNKDQKKLLQDLRKQCLVLLSDNNYYINQINKVREEFLEAIENKKDVKKLKNIWLEAIDKLEQEYLTNDQTKYSIKEVESNNSTKPRKKAIISRKRLRKHDAFRKLRKHLIIFIKASEFLFNNPFMFPEEKINRIASIKAIIDVYKKSLANIFKISQKNIDFIQQSLSDMMLVYQTEEEKKFFRYHNKCFD
ncbi:24539_t:CDS:2 [Cetraspora pellucida]|uniref:24539_t:CDS:1 n=1 Tax=Cetraspora pellucida TaxID=1433469 RepID=A0A9N9H438_9GLOM|nr:24539_t:CDS:2 [Cetraspora pellucida]